MKRQSFLLNLPTELLERVFDILEVVDRIKLNVALGDAAVLKTSRTTTDRDTKLAVVHMFFKRQARTVGVSAVSCEDISSLMSQFIATNLDDPTIQNVVRDFPQIASLRCPPCIDRSTIERLVQRSQMEWADIRAEDIRSVLYILSDIGSPAMFRSIMSVDNHVRTHIIKEPDLFVFGLLNMSWNQGGLLKYIMDLPDGNDLGFPVAQARAYLSRLNIATIFLSRPEQLRTIVETVGIDATTLQGLVVEAAKRFYVPSVIYLLKAGARL